MNTQKQLVMQCSIFHIENLWENIWDALFSWTSF